jgi:hypothetical protein
LYDGVRARLLPQLTRDRYRAGRAAIEAKNFAVAEQELSAAERLIDEAEKAKIADSGLADLRVLVDGFRTLARSERREAPAPLASVATAKPAARPAAKSIYTIDDADVVPPAVVYQAVPAVPATLHLQVARTPRPMILNLTIDETGRVKKVDVIAPINRVYDRMVADAAARWRYRPATKSGVAVPYVKTLAVSVQ